MFKRLIEIKRRALCAAKWMKRNRSLLLLLLLIVIMLVLSGCVHGDAVWAMAIIPGVAGGKHVVDGPVTTDVANEASPGWLLNEIDQQIVKIRPMATPIDQLSRLAGSKHADSMVDDYYNVDTKATTATVKDDYLAEGALVGEIHTNHDEIFDATDTILVQGTYGLESDGSQSKQELVLYVVERTKTGLSVMAVNGVPVKNNDDDDDARSVPDIPDGSILVRMGRAACELDVMSPQFESLPVKARNYCQLFKMQVEQSVLQRLASKEVNWTMTDQQEAAIYDMRLGMEKSFLFGARRKMWDSAKKQNVLFTGGIWQQAGKDFAYDDKMTQDTIVDMMREAFTGNAGSKRKILVAGSGLINRLNKLQYDKVISATDTVTKWGIDFTEMRSKFGSLLVLLSEVFDDCGMADSGLIVDPEYLQKYSHIPFGSETLNLKQSGVRNVDAMVLTEASCLVLRYPKAHMRVSKM